MSESTSISWCDSTFNPWMGCTKVSPACDHCYAERLMDHRMHKVRWGAGQPRVRTTVANWRKPLQWNAQPFVECMGCGWRGEARQAPMHGFDGAPGCVPICPSCKSTALKPARRRVFCASLADVFDNEVPEAWRVDLFKLIAGTPRLDWLLLTKRIGNANAMMQTATADTRARDPGHIVTHNIWLGATVVTQEEADRDIPKLLQVPARVRFLSIEPMLGAVDLLSTGDTLCRCEGCLSMARQHPDTAGLQRIDWIICGGESGPQARPMHPDWVRSLRDQCAAAGVPFHFKQWGEWAPNCLCQTKHAHPEIPRPEPGKLGCMFRCGTKAAGRLLDGIEHNGVPA